MKWEVLKVCAGGERFYQVARTLDPEQPRHAGNFEYAGSFDVKEFAEARAAELNGENENG